MNSLDQLLPFAGLAGLGAALLLLPMVVVLSLKLKAQSQRLATVEAEAARVSTDLAGLLVCEKGVTSRMRSNEAQLTELARLQRQLMNADRDSLAVEHVKKLLERGSSVEEIIGASELSTTELELLAAITRRSERARAEDQRGGLRRININAA